MAKDVFVFEVTEKSFESAVIGNSSKLPVLVEFMVVWSEPCVVMADTLTDLAHDYAGLFIFAKVDVEEQLGLKERFNIENVPSLMVFKDGKPVRTDMGQMTEPELRALLKEYGVFRQSDELREQARAKHLAGDIQGAALLLTQAIQSDPGNTRIAMDMVQIFIDTGQYAEARGLFGRLPQKDRESAIGNNLSGQLLFLELAEKTEGIVRLQQRVDDDTNDFDARFDLALCLVARHGYVQAFDQLFYIVEREREFKQGAAREMISTLINMLKPNDPGLAQVYRRRLSNTLSS